MYSTATFFFIVAISNFVNGFGKIILKDISKVTNTDTKNTQITLVKNTTESRQGKFFGLGVVRFENSVCSSQDGTIGTCYTRRQCHDLGGLGTGYCAAKIGVCCVVQETCGGSSSLNNTYFVNSNYPNSVTSPAGCTFTIKKCNPDICQVRLDFLNFNLAQPNGDGVCNVDSFHVVGGASVIPPICGENSGSHMYVDFNGDEDIRLLVQIGETALSRGWRIKIAQIGCDCPTRAPSGCLQYYTNLTGEVMSFNYGQAVNSNPNAENAMGSRQIANMNYGICVAMEPGYCSITWAPAAGDQFAFTVSGDTTTELGMPGTDCMTDFVVIPNGSVDGMPTNTDRYCGNMLPVVTTSSKPFVLTAVTDANEMGDIANRGFHLMYTQNRCPAPLC